MFFTMRAGARFWPARAAVPAKPWLHLNEKEHPRVNPRTCVFVFYRVSRLIDYAEQRDGDSLQGRIVRALRRLIARLRSPPREIAEFEETIERKIAKAVPGDLAGG